MKLDRQSVEDAACGGALLDGGGRGWPGDGLNMGNLALAVGTPRLVSLEDLVPDALIGTVSPAGAPAAPERYTPR